ncbi:MAG: hypothetical protein HUK22_00590 [Thermoguttaceae bacterium]|nr:hypothetical protein [Thermoguttaceae bacterium]
MKRRLSRRTKMMCKKRFFTNASFTRVARLLGAAFGAVALVAAFHSDSALAQTASRPVGGSRYVHRPSLPTDELASFHRIGDPAAGYMQPVAFLTPSGVRVGLATDGAFVYGKEPTGEENPRGLQTAAVAAFALGRTYRLQISNIPYNPGRVLYPTLEVIGKLTPPAGREWEFPVEVVVPQEDLELALKGNMVVRVIFVEDSANALAVDTGEPNAEITVDVPSSADPVAVAETRGRAVAILRLGSRVPVGAPRAEDPFFFGMPRFELPPTVSARALEIAAPVEKEVEITIVESGAEVEVVQPAADEVEIEVVAPAPNVAE